MSKIEFAKKQVKRAGLELSEKKLVARTWGNVSCRVDSKSFVITPSGIKYEDLEVADIVLVEIGTLKHKEGTTPSSEKKVHDIIYRKNPHVNFIIHTHQAYASAVSLINKKDLTFFDFAEYALPGTDELSINLDVAMKNSDAGAVILRRHGVVAYGKSYEEAFLQALELEEQCKKIVFEKTGIRENFTGKYKKLNIPLEAYLDDFAQIIGDKTIEFDARDSVEASIIEKNAMTYFATSAFGKVEKMDEKDIYKMHKTYTDYYSLLADKKN